MQHKEFRAEGTGKNVKALVQNAREYIKEKRFDEALDAYEKILQENPEAAAAYMGVGSVHLREGRLDEAENYFKGALHVTKKVAPVLVMLANVALQRGEVDKALKLNQEALDADPKFLKAALGLGKVFFQTQRYDEARTVVADTLKYNPNANEAQILLSRIMQKMGQSDAAMENLNQLLCRDPKAWTAYFQQALMHLRENRFEAAIEAADKSLQLKPENIRTQVCLGQALIGSKKYLKAIDVLTGIIATHPDMWHAKMLLAEAYFVNGDLEEAKELLNKMAKGRRGLGSIHFMLGDIFAHQKLFTHALAEYEAGVLHSEKLIEKFPQLFPQLQELVGKPMEESEKTEEFKRLLTQIRKHTDAQTGELSADASEISEYNG